MEGFVDLEGRVEYMTASSLPHISVMFDARSHGLRVIDLGRHHGGLWKGMPKGGLEAARVFIMAEGVGGREKKAVHGGRRRCKRREQDWTSERVGKLSIGYWREVSSTSL